MDRKYENDKYTIKITKQGRKGEQRIPHLLCSNDHNTSHLGDELG